MAAVTWNDIPADLQDRVCTQGVSAVGELASWAYVNRPCWARNDDLHDILCALIVFLLRAEGHPGRQIQSLPAILTTIAYRQRCQRFRDKMTEREAQLPFEPAGDEPPPFAQLTRFELRVSMQVALKSLNPKEREALIRKHVGGQSYREIAKAVYGPNAGDKEGGFNHSCG